jgi:hypothetical protein
MEKRAGGEAATIAMTSTHIIRTSPRNEVTGF